MYHEHRNYMKNINIILRYVLAYVLLRGNEVWKPILRFKCKSSESLVYSSSDYGD
jgi:hypothetical protein